MHTTQWTKADTHKAQQLWADYLRAHDVADRAGQTVGIDPATGRLWFGDSIPAVVESAKATGVDRPLFFVRVGSDHYYRKGGHR